MYVQKKVDNYVVLVQLTTVINYC